MLCGNRNLEFTVDKGPTLEVSFLTLVPHQRHRIMNIILSVVGHIQLDETISVRVKLK